MYKKKIAVLGTQGVPNKYGGFETLVEYLIEYLSDEYEIIVFCSSKIYKERPKKYKNVKLKYLPFDANGPQSIIYDSLSVLLSLRYDKILLLGSTAGFILPIIKFHKHKFILNFGGLDWQRSKWNLIAQKLLKLLEKLSIKNSELIIADNKGIQNYISKNYSRDSYLIEYGGNQVKTIQYNDKDVIKYSFLEQKYAFSIARIQPDNNIEMILNSFITSDKILVFVGNWDSSKYGENLKRKFKNQYSSIIILDAIYDQRELDLLRSNCEIYIHGHSAGGTNPSLVEAMNLGLAIIAYASGFNEFTTENEAIYFKDELDLQNIVKNLSDYKLDNIRFKMLDIALQKYNWELITKKYAEIFNK